MNGNILRGIMAMYGDTIKDLAHYLGKTEQIVSKKINEKGTEFKQGEITKIKERYHLTADQIDLIFFAE